MKLSEKILHHAEAAENQGIDGVWVPKARLHAWAERAKATEANDVDVRRSLTMVIDQNVELADVLGLVDDGLRKIHTQAKSIETRLKPRRWWHL